MSFIIIHTDGSHMLAEGTKELLKLFDKQKASAVLSVDLPVDEIELSWSKASGDSTKNGVPLSDSQEEVVSKIVKYLESCVPAKMANGRPNMKKYFYEVGEANSMRQGSFTKEQSERIEDAFTEHAKNYFGEDESNHPARDDEFSISSCRGFVQENPDRMVKEAIDFINTADRDESPHLVLMNFIVPFMRKFKEATSAGATREQLQEAKDAFAQYLKDTGWKEVNVSGLNFPGLTQDNQDVKGEVL